MIRVLLVLAVGYAAIIAMLAGFQTRLLFPAWMVPGDGALPAGAEELSVTAADGVTLRGAYLPGGDPDAPLLLGFGGNAWSAGAVAQTLRGVFPEHPVAALDYRGYGRSGGRPSAAALMEDAEAIHDALEDRARGGIVPVGISVGSGPAARIVAARDPVGAVLVTPFDSLEAVARDVYPWAPVRLLFRHEMPVAEMLAGTRTPLALILAGEDEIIPAARSHALHEALPEGVALTVIEGAGHNDLAGDPRFAESLRAALAHVTGTRN